MRVMQFDSEVGDVLRGLLIALFFRGMRKDKPLQSIGLGPEPPEDSQRCWPERCESTRMREERNPRLSALPA